MSDRLKHLSIYLVVVMFLWTIMVFTGSITHAARNVQNEYDDHQNMMDQLGIKQLRPGANPNNQSTFDEATANPYKDSMPDVLTMKYGTRVTSAAQWPRRRAEIIEDFEREVYGRIPPNVPKVTWEVSAVTDGNSAGIPTVTKKLIGRVDNSAYPGITVNIQASFTVPAAVKGPVPMMLEFGFGFRFPGRRGSGPGRPSGPSWTEQAISNGWGYGTIVPVSIQPDRGGMSLRRGIIGLANKGEPRKPDQWGALRAWGWGVSRLIDFFEAHPDAGVDPKKVGIEGVSRYGKAALVTAAFDERVAVTFVASSGEGGAKLHRHIFGEAVENLTGRGEYHWMAGNFLKYGASDPCMTASDLPVDSHELIALCAPRPCFISYGVLPSDPPWVDAHGSFMAGVLAGPVYRLLGKKDFGTPGNYLTDPMPPVGKLIGGELAWRQHEGGHTSGPNWPAFFEWVSWYIKAPPLPLSNAPSSVKPAAASNREQASGRPAAPASVRPIARMDRNSRIAHSQLLEKAGKGRIDVYFEGDSIMRRWGALDYPKLLANWKENFFGWNAADFAWGGDTVQNILWRLENGELDNVHPKVIVLQAGTNNIGNRPSRGENDPRIAEVCAGIRAILDICQAKAPEAKVILTGIFPRNDNAGNPTGVIPLINRINETLAAMADEKKIRYININDKLADKAGKLYPGMTMDRLHLSVKGCQVWADALKPILTELLGPPAKEDHAPPPTGDPSARSRSR
jgi:lysophospholipase L1-like esterase